jgi:pimeloyl-ACP methyl ester carboxylesterase
VAPAAVRAQVILLHGIWMRAPTLWWLERGLRAEGFDTARFDYASVFGSPAAAVERLRARMRAAGPGPVHLVGHSLGGLVAIAACRDARDLPPGRIACIGSPLAGSRAARRVDAWPGLRALAGGWRHALIEGAGPLPADREVGVIAGTRSLGLGALLARLPRPHDGTVAVDETRVPALADHATVDGSHTGMLLEPVIARRVANFLREGRFSAPAAAAGGAARGPRG